MKKIRSLLQSMFSSKKRVILFALVFLFLAAGVVVAISFLGPKTVVGSWELTVNPETAILEDDSVEETERVFYIFEKPDRSGKGTWQIRFNGGVEYYEYQLTKENGTRKINLGSADLTYRIVGSKLFGTAKMTLVYPETTDPGTGETREALEYGLEQRKAPDYGDMSYEEFKTDDRLTGEWATNARFLTYYTYTLPYNQGVTFTRDGIMTIRYESEQLEIDRYLYYAYSVADGELTFSPVLEKEKSFTVRYGFDKDGNLIFLDDTTSDSIFADEFFGDAVYYPPTKLPEPPENTGGSDVESVE